MVIDPTDPTGLQKAMLRVARRDDIHTIIAVGAVRGGKTAGMVMIAIDDALYDFANGIGNGDYIVGAQTLGSVQRNMGSYFRSLCESFGLSFKEVGGINPHYAVGGFAKFYMFGGEKADSCVPVRGMTATRAYLDEGTKLHKTFVQECYDRCSFDESRVIICTNSDNPHHWFLRERVKQPSSVKVTLLPDAELTPSQTAANALLNKPEGHDRVCVVFETNFYDNHHYSEVQRQFHLSGDPTSTHYRRMILGEWVSEEGLVYPIEPEYITDKEVALHGTVCLDLGTSGTTAALLLVKQQGKIIVADEYYHIGSQSGIRSDNEHIDALLRKWKFQKIVVDKTASGFKSACRRRGLTVRDGNNRKEIGLYHYINSLLRAGDILIHQRCDNFLTETASLVWDELTEKPEKLNDHACDAFKYGILNVRPPRRVT